MQDNYSKQIYFILLFFAVVLIGALCKIMGNVFLPVVVATLLSFILLPLVQKLNKKLKISWVFISIILVVLLIVGILFISTLLLGSLTTIVSEYPKYESKFMAIYQVIASNFNLEFDESKSFIQNIWNFLEVRQTIQDFAIFLSTGIFSFGKSFLMIFLLLSFLLIEMRLTAKKVNYAFVGKAKTKVLKLSSRIINETMNYLSIKFFVSLATGLLVYLATLLLKMDFPIVWGFLAFIMNFIPTFGSIISTILTTLFAVLQFYPEIGKPVFILIYMILINFIIGNILEPKIEGKHLGLSPFAILVCLSVWGYIWGFVGMILAVPLTVIIKIICENISYLHLFAIMLGSDPVQTRKDLNQIDEEEKQNNSI